MLEEDIQKQADEILEEQKLEEEANEIKRQAALDMELAKFKANACDRASTSVMSVAIFTPIVGYFYHASNVAFMSSVELTMSLVACLVAAAVLHMFGRSTLEGGFK